MDPIHVVLKLPRKIGDFIIAAQKIHDTMAANTATIKAPSPTLPVFQTDITALVTQQALAKTRAEGAVAARDAAKKVVNDDLTKERAYVETLCNADPTNAASIAGDAGMTLRKAVSRNKPALAATHGTASGMVKLTAKAVKNTQLVDWQSSSDGGKTWVDAPQTTKAVTMVTGLTPATTVMFRQRVYVRKTGWGDWTPAVPFVVQ